MSSTDPIRPLNLSRRISTPADTDVTIFDTLLGLAKINWADLKTAVAAALSANPTNYKLANLDGTNKIPTTLLPVSLFGGLTYIGGSAGGAVPNTATQAGYFYVITAAGTSQGKTWAVGDLAFYNGTSGSWSQVTNGVAQVGTGGTGATTAKTARDNLGVTAVYGVSITDFGADKTGAADSTTALLNAITATPTGGTLIVPDGTFSIAPNTSIVRSDITIRGTGTLKCGSASTSIWIIWNGSRVNFHGLTFDGNHNTKTCFFFANYSTNWTFRDCKVKGIQNNAGTGVATDVTDCFIAGRGCRDFRFEDVTFDDVDSTYTPGAGASGVRCIRFGMTGGGTDWTNDRFDDIRIINCDFTNIGPTQLDADPIVFQNQIPDANGDQIANFIIRGCKFRNQGRRAIKLECGGGIVSNNDIYSSLAGPIATSGMFAAISVYGAKTVVCGNKIHGGCYQYGIEVAWLTTFGQPRGVVISANTIEMQMATRTGCYGIIFKGAKQCSATGNTVNGTDFGICVGGNCQDIALGDNNTDRIASYGIVTQTLTAGSGESFAGTPDSINISGGVVNSDSYSIFLSAGTSVDVDQVKGAAGTQFYFRNTGVTGMSFFGKRTETATADQAITNSNALVDATGLAVPLSANRKYRFRAVLVIDNAGTAAGVKIAMAGPTAPTKVLLTGFLENSITTVVHQVTTSLTTIIAQPVGTTGVKYAVMEGTIQNGANTGDLKVQIAQNTSDANATTLKAGSWLEVERLS